MFIMKNKKIFPVFKIKYFLYITFLFLVIIISCDDPVSPPYRFDAPRYSWDIDTLYNRVWDICGPDTNNIFIVGISQLIKFDGVKNIYYPLGLDLFGLSIDAADKNNVFIGGNDRSHPYFPNPKIKKWDGNTLIDLPINDPEGKKYSILRILAISPDEVWFGGDKGKLLKYNGNDFEFYNFDTTSYVAPLKKDFDNNVYIETWKPITNPQHTEGELFIDIYKFNSNNFKKVYSWYVNSNISQDSTFEIISSNNEIYNTCKNNIYRFSNNNFQKIFPVYLFHLSNLLDIKSENEFLCDGIIKSEQVDYIFHWNGKSFSKEIMLPGFNAFSGIKINNKYYCLVNNFTSTVSFLYKGSTIKN